MSTPPLVLALGDRRPRIAPTAWLAPGTVVTGEVAIGADSSLWYGAVLRGDCSRIVIGERTNLQDGVVVHVERGADGVRRIAGFARPVLDDGRLGVEVLP